jgi:succinoglycan biosynthesis protein ExoA
MKEFPFVTIIMPIRNEASFVERSLGAVVSQDYPRDRIEIIVVDGMSDDGTREIVEQIIEKYSAKDVIDSEIRNSPYIAILDNPSRIVPTAFNIALRHALGDVIVRVDGHCEIEPDYVRRCVTVLRQTGADNVGGLQRAVGKDQVGRAIAMATSSPLGIGGSRFHYADKPGWVDTVYLGAYRREVFTSLGGFDEELVRNQDDEFNFRLIQAGGKIWLDPAINSIYFSRASFRTLWRQYFQYGFYKVLVMQKREAVASWRHLVPAAFVLAMVLGLSLALVFHQPSLLYIVSGFYAIIYTTASLWMARKDWKLFPLLPITFTIVHLAYGTGFLWGLWYWRKYWFIILRRIGVRV